MTDKKNKPKTLKEYAQAAQQRLQKSHKPQKQFNKPNNFRPQGRGR